MVGKLQSTFMPPCPYTPDFLDDQRRRLLAAGDRLRVQLAGAPTLALGPHASWSAAGDPAAAVTLDDLPDPGPFLGTFDLGG